MYGALLVMGLVFILVALAMAFAVAFLLWWLVRSRKRELYFGVFVLLFLCSVYSIWDTASGVSFVWYFVVAAWTSFISSIAIWRAASRDQKFWFVFLYIFSLWGILPAIYVWVVEKMKVSEWYE